MPQRAAARLAAELADPAALPLEAVAAARELSGVTDAALRAAVDRARAAGQSWGRIGEVLGTTRQAAFQRFGHPDPHRGYVPWAWRPGERGGSGLVVEDQRQGVVRFAHGLLGELADPVTGEPGCGAPGPRSTTPDARRPDRCGG